jgi:hypothetical protein
VKKLAFALLSVVALVGIATTELPVHATGTTPAPTLLAPVSNTQFTGATTVSFTLGAAQQSGSVKLTLISASNATTNRTLTFSDNALDINHHYSGNIDLLDAQSVLESNPIFIGYSTKVENVTTTSTRMPAGRYTISISYQNLAGDPQNNASATGVGLDACGLGTYSATTNGFIPLSGGCTPSSMGHYVNTLGATTEIACSTGTFQSNSLSSSCNDAPAGFYVNLTGQAAPIPCPANTWTSGTGSTSSSDCTATFATPHIYWLEDTDSSTPGHSISTAISGTSGLLGTFTVYETAEVPMSGPSLGGTTITQNGSGTSIESNTTSNITSASRFSIKYVPGQGSTFASRTFEDLQAVCSPGRYSTDGFGPCVKSPAGKFVAYPQSTQADRCPAGTFQPTIGQMSCIQAEPGHFVSQSGATSQQECAPGTYQPNPATLSCIQASVGSYVSGYAATSQSACAVGTTTTVQSSTSCVPVVASTSTNSTTSLNKKLAKGKKAKLASMIKPTKGAKLKWSVSGGCKISGTYVVAPKKAASCKLTLKQTVTSNAKSKKTTTTTSRVGITVS